MNNPISIYLNRNRFISLFIFVLWFLIIFYESSLPPPKILSIFPGIDKLGHFIIYCIFAFIVSECLSYSNINDKKKYIFTLIIIFILGIFDELHQNFVPKRNLDIYDLFADILGGLFSVIALTYKNKNYQKNAAT